jgi:hypothetical protein
MSHMLARASWTLCRMRLVTNVDGMVLEEHSLFGWDVIFTGVIAI